MFGGLVLAICLASAAVAMAAKVIDAHLDGKFKTTLTVQRDDVNPENEGEKLKREYTFKATCKKGTCDTVKVARETSSGSKVKYELERTSKGTYEGHRSGHSSGVSCNRGDDVLYQSPGTQDEDMKVQITADNKDGDASKIKGTLHIVLPTMKGPITPQECEDYFADRGLHAGDRPEQQSKFKGKLEK
jgi:hypothetical protein